MTIRDSSSSFVVDLQTIQNFLPIIELGQKKPLNFLFPGADILKSDQSSAYTNLRTSTTIGFVRTFIPNSLIANEVYDLSSSQLNVDNINIAFIDKGKSLFFIGLPLHHCDAFAGTVESLLDKILFEEFGLTP
jgi:hypothetical protein